MIRSLILFSLLALSGKFYAQENSWSATMLSYFDDPLKLSNNNSTDLRGSSLKPGLNFGQTFIIENKKYFRSNFNSVLGIGFGYSRIKLKYVSTLDFLNNPFERDLSGKVTLIHSKYFIAFGGLSHIKQLKKRFHFIITVRGGLIAPLRSSIGYKKLITDNNRTVTLLETELFINRSGIIYPILIPEFSVGYNIPKENLRFTLGVGSMISPISFVEGEVTLNGEPSSYKNTVSDKIYSIGLTLGLHYVFN